MTALCRIFMGMGFVVDTGDSPNSERDAEGAGPIHSTSYLSDRSQYGHGDQTAPRRRTRPAFLACICALAVGVLCGCDLVPTKPDAVFLVYKDRVRAERWPEARELLSNESRDLVNQLDKEYKLTQPPESLALLNVLDPVSPPTVLKSDDAETILQLRTLKGGLRTLKLIRKSPNDRWKIDMTGDLKVLNVFLEGHRGLDILREQAGEFGESWKAFNEKLGRSHFLPQAPAPAVKPAHPKPPPKKPKGPAGNGETKKPR